MIKIHEEVNDVQEYNRFGQVMTLKSDHTYEINKYIRIRWKVFNKNHVIIKSTLPI